MTCVYICGLHLNNDSLREGEEDVETVMGMGERKVARKREVRRHLLVLKKKKKMVLWFYPELAQNADWATWFLSFQA